MALVLDVGDADGESITVVVAETAIVLRVGKLLRSLKMRWDWVSPDKLYACFTIITTNGKLQTFFSGRTSFCLRYSVTKDGAT